MDEGPLTVVVFTKEITFIDDKRTGQLARLHRKSMSKSLKKLAEDMGISFGHLSKLERGVRGWSLELIAKFNKAIRR